MQKTRGWERAVLAGVVGFALVALVGFGWFGMHPERLAGLGSRAAAFYGASYRVFALGQVAVAAAALVAVLVARTGWRWVPAFAAVYGLSLASELAGTGWGIPFGDYGYARVLAPMWMGRVPVVIPLSWFMMGVAAYGLAGGRGTDGATDGGTNRDTHEHTHRHTHRHTRRGVVGGGLGAVMLGAFWLLAWDLALDPAMSRVTRYWMWGEAGPYYGMPLLNLFGWFVTGLVLMIALRAFGADRWLAEVPRRWLVGFYGANLLLPLGMCVLAGYWGAVLATSLALVFAARMTRFAAEGAVIGGLPAAAADAGGRAA